MRIFVEFKKYKFMNKAEISLEMYNDFKEKESTLESILRNESVVIEVIERFSSEPTKYRYIKREDFLNEVLEHNKYVMEQLNLFKEESVNRLEEEVSFRKELMKVLEIPNQWDVNFIKNENFLEIAKSKKDKAGIMNRLKKWFEGI